MHHACAMPWQWLATRTYVPVHHGLSIGLNPNKFRVQLSRNKYPPIYSCTTQQYERAPVSTAKKNINGIQYPKGIGLFQLFFLNLLPSTASHSQHDKSHLVSKSPLRGNPPELTLTLACVFACVPGSPTWQHARAGGRPCHKLGIRDWYPS